MIDVFKRLKELLVHRLSKVTDVAFCCLKACDEKCTCFIKCFFLFNIVICPFGLLNTEMCRSNMLLFIKIITLLRGQMHVIEKVFGELPDQIFTLIVFEKNF